MKNVTISEEAYNEFKAFLEENKITDFNIRLNFAGFDVADPIFIYPFQKLLMQMKLKKSTTFHLYIKKV